MPRLPLLAASLAVLLVSSTARSAEPVFAERLQIVHDRQTNSVERRRIKVEDPHPELGLEFTWEPKAGMAGLSDDGLAEGEGRLIWRVRGSADYDPKAVYSTYKGELKAGRPDGKGRLVLRSGDVLEGQWRDGHLDGQGIRRSADGSRYEGAFKTGLEDGAGRLTRANGSIHDGSFRQGLPHGAGTFLAADGGKFESVWDMGIETGPRKLIAKGGSNAGGRIGAQTASGGDAANFEIGFAVDARITEEAPMQYQHLVQEQDVAIYPVDQDINDAWGGTREILAGTWPFDMTDWEDAPAYVELSLAATNGKKAKVESLALEVSSSETFNKPFLAIEAHLGCVAFRPSFSFLNYGWGDTKSAKISMKFVNEERSAESAETYSADLGNFGDGLDVPLRDILSQAGVDVAALETKRFPCPSADQLGVCKAQLMNAVKFGDVANAVWGEDKLFATALGKIDYTWTDESGHDWPQSEPFNVDIALARIEYPEELAECGDGSGASPEALRYQDVDLPLGKKDYMVDVPVRGNKTLKDYTARLKLFSQKTSFHQFKAVAKFADGSTLQSKPASFYFFRPRERSFASKATPAACYLSPDDGSC